MHNILQKYIEKYPQPLCYTDGLKVIEEVMKEHRCKRHNRKGCEDCKYGFIESFNQEMRLHGHEV